MKQPPPPYCQVAMTPNPIVPTTNENQTTMPSGTQAIPSTCDDVRSKIPPAYEEIREANRVQSNNNSSSSSENRPILNTMNHANDEVSSSVSLTLASSSSSANDLNGLPVERPPNH